MPNAADFGALIVPHAPAWEFSTQRSSVAGRWSV